MCPMGHHLSNPDGSVSANEAAYFEARGGRGRPRDRGQRRHRVAVGHERRPHDRGVRRRPPPSRAARPRTASMRTAPASRRRSTTRKMSLLGASEGRPMLVPYVPHPGLPDPLDGHGAGRAQMTAPFTREGALRVPRRRGRRHRGGDRPVRRGRRPLRAGGIRRRGAPRRSRLPGRFLSPHNRDDEVGRRPRRAVAVLIEIIGAIRAGWSRFPSGSGSTPPSRTRTTANGSTSSSR